MTAACLADEDALLGKDSGCGRGGWGLVVEAAGSRSSPRGLDDQTPAIRRMGMFPAAPVFTPVEDSARAGRAC